MIHDFKTIAIRSRATLLQDFAGAAALVCMLLVSLQLSAPM